MTQAEAETDVGTALAKAKGALGRFIVWSEGPPGMWLWSSSQRNLHDLTAAGEAMDAVTAALNTLRGAGDGNA